MPTIITTTTTTTERKYPDELSTCNKVNDDLVAENEKLNVALKTEQEKNTNIEDQVEAKDIKIEKLQLELVKKSSIDNQGIQEEKFKELLMKLEAKIESKFDETLTQLKITNAKLAVVDTNLDATKDLMQKDFTSINATCSSFDHKLDVMNANLLSRCFRKP